MLVVLMVMVRMLRLPEVERAVGVSGTTIWRWEREGKFPRRRRVGPNAVAWRSDEVEKWIRERPVAEEEAAGVGR